MPKVFLILSDLSLPPSPVNGSVWSSDSILYGFVMLWLWVFSLIVLQCCSNAVCRICCFIPNCDKQFATLESANVVNDYTINKKLEIYNAALCIGVLYV